MCSSSGKGGPGGTVRNAKKPVSSSGCCRQELAVPREHLGRCVDRPEDRAGDHRRHRVQLERERRDDAEVAAAAADRPEEIRVLVLARADEAAVGEHDVRGEHVVDRQAVLPRQVSDAAAEQEADACRADDPDRRCEPEGVRRVVDVGRACAAADLRRARVGIDARPSASARGRSRCRRRRSRSRRRCVPRREPRCRDRSPGRTRAPRCTSATSRQRATSAGRLSIIAL